MKVYLRDRITAGFGVGVLAILAAVSYYYSLHSSITANRAMVDRESPDFITTGIAVTTFKPDGQPQRRIFADWAEHYTDGRQSSIRPKMVSLSPDEPQTTASADAGQSMDDGQTYLFTGNVVLTRAGDLENAPLRFTTTHLTVYPDTGRAETDAPVRITSGSDITTGIGLTFDNVERTVDIHSHVRSSFMPRSANTTPQTP